MAILGSDKVQVFLVNGLDLLGISTQFTPTVSGNNIDITPLGVTWVTKSTDGTVDGTISHEGFYDDDTTTSLETLNSNIGSAYVVCMGVEGNTIAKPFIGGQSMLITDFAHTSVLKDVQKFAVNYTTSTGSDALERGQIIYPKGTTPAGSGYGTGVLDVSNGDTTNGVNFYVQVLAITGSPTGLAFKLQHSTTDGSYADLTSMSINFGTSAPGASFLAAVASQTVHKYVRLYWTFTGGSSPTATVFAGIARQ